MKVRNRFSRVRMISPSPTGIAKIYEERLNKDGVMDLLQTGEHDLNEFVQTSLEGTKVYNILEAFERSQDPSILNSVTGYFADVTDMPADLMAAQNLILSIDKKFAALPLDVKEKFDNSPQKFYQAFMDGSAAQILGDFAQNSSDPKPSAEADPTPKVGDN